MQYIHLLILNILKLVVFLNIRLVFSLIKFIQFGFQLRLHPSLHLQQLVMKQMKYVVKYFDLYLKWVELSFLNMDATGCIWSDQFIKV